MFDDHGDYFDDETVRAQVRAEQARDERLCRGGSRYRRETSWVLRELRWRREARS